MSSRTLWITGASGFSGRHLSALVGTDPEITVVGISQNAKDIEGVDRAERLDLRDERAVAKLASKFAPDYIIHLAGAMPPSPLAEIWSANSAGTLGLMTGLWLGGVRSVKIVNIGSAAQYIRSTDGHFNEMSPTGGSSDYGRAKCMQEAIVRECGFSMGYEVILARVFNLLGPGLSTDLVIGNVCDQLRSGKNTLALGRLDSVRDFLDIRDAVRAYWQLALYGIPGETYNVCSGRESRILDLVNLAIELSGQSVEISRKETFSKQGDVDKAIGENTKLLGAIGWQAEIDLSDSVRDMLA